MRNAICAFLLCLFYSPVLSMPMPGKYLCIVSDMVQTYPSEPGGHLYSGNMDPLKSRYHINVHDADHSACGQSKLPPDFTTWWVCQAKYQIDIEGQENLRGDAPNQFIVSHSTKAQVVDNDVIPEDLGYDSFVLLDSGEFRYFETAFDHSYESEGRCTKY